MQPRNTKPNISTESHLSTSKKNGKKQNALANKSHNPTKMVHFMIEFSKNSKLILLDSFPTTPKATFW